MKSPSLEILVNEFSSNSFEKKFYQAFYRYENELVVL